MRYQKNRYTPQKTLVRVLKWNRLLILPFPTSGVAKGGQSGQLPPPLGGLDSENFIVESVVHTAELDVFFNHL